jgi:hypothetical protein
MVREWASNIWRWVSTSSLIAFREDEVVVSEGGEASAGRWIAGCGMEGDLLCHQDSDDPA